jgi:hypothetical protein
MADPAAVLADALDVLSRSEIERAWTAAEAVHKALGGNIALRAEVAAYLLAQILAEIGNTSNRTDLADVAAALEALSVYLNGRMVTIVTEAATDAHA